MTHEEQVASLCVAVLAVRDSWHGKHPHVVQARRIAAASELAACVQAGRPSAAALLVDDPALDATDAAHPAWWRGHDHTCERIVEQLTAALEGRDRGDGALNHAGLERLRRALIAQAPAEAQREEGDGGT